MGLDPHSRVRRILIAVVGILLVTIIIFLPYIIEWIYYNVNPPIPFFDIQMLPQDLLSYFGSAFTLIATVALGVITLHQNQIAQNKSDMIDLMTLDLQRKSMAMAEAQYKRNEQDSIYLPKFEIRVLNYLSRYANLNLSIKNVTSKIISQIEPLELIAEDSDGKEITRASRLYCVDSKGRKGQKSLGPGAAFIVKTDTEELSQLKTGSGTKVSYQNFRLIFKFSCEDEKGYKYYYTAQTQIVDSGTYSSGDWKCERTG